MPSALRKMSQPKPNIQDFVIIRKGTNPRSALDKTIKILWNYLLSNSKSFKVEQKLTINFSGCKL